MKKLFTLLFVFLAALGASAEEVTFDFQNNPLNWTVGEGKTFTDGALANPVTIDDVTLTSVQGEASYPAILMKDNNNVISLNVYNKGAIKFNAAEGKAIVKVEATMKSKTFALTPSTGAITENTWVGNATEVTFVADALYSFLKIVVTTAAENAETVKPAAVTYDVEVADIAAFNAIEDGKVAKLTLTNARVNAVKSGSYYVEDASGATVFKGLDLTAGTALNGYVIGTKSTDGSVDMNETFVEYALTATDASTFEASTTILVGTVMTGAEAAVQANYGKLITLENVAITGTGQNKTLSVDGTSLPIKARDYMGVLPTGFTWPENASKLTGVLIYYYGWVLMPISADAIVAAGSQSEALFDFVNNNMELTYGENGTADQQNAGNLAGKKLTQGDVTLTFVNSPSIAVKAYYLSAKGKHFQIGTKNGKLRITAAEGKAITKIEVTQNLPESATNFVNWEVDKGEGTLSEDMKTWVGNATSVRFNTKGATYINAIKVTTAAVNEQTVTPADDAYTTEVSTLAELNALPAGTLVKLNLNNVVVTTEFANKLGYYIQDATAGTALYATTLSFNLNDVLNGYVYLNRADNEQKNPGNRVAMAEATNAEHIQVTSNGTYSPVEGTTIAAVNTPANICKVVQFNNVKVKGTGAKAADINDSAEQTIKISNPGNNFGTNVYTEDMTNLDVDNATVVGVLIATASSGNQVYPISITANTNGISEINAAKDKDVQIYNLQGVRLNSLQKGLNIVNGKKVVIK